VKPCWPEHGEFREGCGLCWLNRHDPRYQRLWSRMPGLLSPAHKALCLHLGIRVTPPEAPDSTRDWRRCEKGHGLVCPCGACKTCPDHEPDDPVCFGPVGARYLAFHLLPVKGNGNWQRSIDQLRLRWGLFTGIKVVAIATGSAGLPLDSPDEVRDYLPSGCEVIEVPNNPDLREVVSWIPLWERILGSASDEDAVLYAHGKAVTRPVDPGNSCQWWASLAYSLHLDHWPLVATQLARYPITGAFKKVGMMFPGTSWHYSGTFYWVRVGDFRSRQWQRIQQAWFGTEAWPGVAYDPTEAGCIFLDDSAELMDLYDPILWNTTIRPRYAEWLKQNPSAFPWSKSS
jgi:hypothetical protein